jgi:GntR family transcriptional regulator/MocR family aminotransferase
MKAFFNERNGQKFNVSEIQYNSLRDADSRGILKAYRGSGIYIFQGARICQAAERIIDYCVTAFSAKELSEDIIGFHSGNPALDCFRAINGAGLPATSLKEAPDSAFGYDYPQGRPELRNTLAAYLKKTRGINCRRLSRLSLRQVRSKGLSLVAKTPAAARK